jgi:hypothetical protein
VIGVRYVQDYAMYIPLVLLVVVVVEEEERTLKWSQLHWLKV